MEQTKKELATLIMLVICSVGTSVLLFECKKSPAPNYSNSGSGSTNGSPGANEVWIQNLNFTPATMSIAPNTSITWSNKDAVAHTVTSTTGAFESGNIPAGGSYTRTFSATGTFPYKCSYHTTMTGTVVVQ